MATLMLACGSGKSSKVQPPPQPPDVYVAGFEDNSSNLEIATYWKNGTAVTLGEGTYGSAAYSIVVSNGDVYVAGNEGSSSGNDIAKYWLNGTPVELTDGTQESVALSILVDSNNDVYVAGIEGGDAMYWKDGVPVPLTTATVNNSAEAWAIGVSGGDVYVAGWQYVTTQTSPNSYYTAPVAMLWTNGVATELSNPLGFGVAQGLFLSGSDVYVAGNTCQPNTGPGCSQATYWENGTPVVLTNQTNTGAVSVAVSGSDVYVAGVSISGSFDIADLWTNGTLTQLSTEYSAANGVVVSGSDVYVGGANTAGGKDVAGYWKDGVFTAVTDGTYFAAGFAITVVPH